MFILSPPPAQGTILTTQFFIANEPRNQRDGVFRDIRTPAAQQTVLSDYTPLKNSPTGELAAHYDLVLGLTPKA